MYQPGRDLEDKLNQLSEKRQNYANSSKILMCASKAVTMYCTAGGIFPKEDLVESLAQYAPQLFENERITDYLSDMPRKIGKEEAKGLSSIFLDESKNYIKQIKELEDRMEIEKNRPSGGLKRTIYSMFDGQKKPDIIEDEYRPKDNTLHSWVENLWIDLHNHMVKSFKE